MNMKKKGFTLIELIVVMAILAILVTLAVPKFLGQTEKAHNTKLHYDAKVVETACDMYNLEHGDRATATSTPLTAEELAAEPMFKIGDINFESPITPDPDSTYYSISESKIKPYLSGLSSNINNFVLQYPDGIVRLMKNEPSNGESSSEMPSCLGIRYTTTGADLWNETELGDIVITEFDVGALDGDGNWIYDMDLYKPADKLPGRIVSDSLFTDANGITNETMKINYYLTIPDYTATFKCTANYFAPDGTLAGIADYTYTTLTSDLNRADYALGFLPADITYDDEMAYFASTYPDAGSYFGTKYYPLMFSNGNTVSSISTPIYTKTGAVGDLYLTATVNIYYE